MKKIYFEVMRIMAMCLVIFNHLPGYSLYQVSTGWKQLIYMSLTMITRINVPLFFMISGALLLKKQETIGVVLKTRFLRFLELIFIFDVGLFFFYKLNAVYNHFEYEFTIKRFFYGAIADNLDGIHSYWYLYAYLGMLLILPFMQRIAKGLTKQEIKILVIGHFLIFTLIPIINLILSSCKLDLLCLSSDFNVPFISIKAFFYPIIGYYLEYFIDVSKIKRKKIICMLVCMVIGILISSGCTYIEGIQTGNYTQNYVELFDYVSAMVMFLLIKYYSYKYQNKFVKSTYAICLIGSLTLGIYVLDPYLKLFIYNRYEMWMNQRFPVIIVSMGWILISAFLGGIITIVMKKIPGLRKIL